MIKKMAILRDVTSHVVLLVEKIWWLIRKMRWLIRDMWWLILKIMWLIRKMWRLIGKDIVAHKGVVLFI